MKSYIDQKNSTLEKQFDKKFEDLNQNFANLNQNFASLGK